MRPPPMSTWEERHQAFLDYGGKPADDPLEPAFQAGYVMATHKLRKLWAAAHALREGWRLGVVEGPSEFYSALIDLRDAVEELAPELNEQKSRVRRLFLDKLHASDPQHPFCLTAQNRGEWTPPEASES